jgi:hypothetical protein
MNAKLKCGVLASAAALLCSLAVASGAAAQTISVDPSTNLPDFAVVNVSGSGWDLNQPGSVLECKAGVFACTDVIGSFATTGTGTFGPIAASVTRVFTDIQNGSPHHAYDCEVVGCELRASENDLAVETTAPISFGGGGSTIMPVTTPPAQTSVQPTGLQAAALMRCKKLAKKKDWSKERLKRCKRSARLLPV